MFIKRYNITLGDLLLIIPLLFIALIVTIGEIIYYAIFRRKD